LPPLRDLRLEVSSAFCDAALQFGICVAKRRLGALSLADLMLELTVPPEPIAQSSGSQVPSVSRATSRRRSRSRPGR
jgi:hypothetical protein